MYPEYIQKILIRDPYLQMRSRIADQLILKDRRDRMVIIEKYKDGSSGIIGGNKELDRVTIRTGASERPFYSEVMTWLSQGYRLFLHDEEITSDQDEGSDYLIWMCLGMAIKLLDSLLIISDDDGFHHQQFHIENTDTGGLHVLLEVTNKHGVSSLKECVAVDNGVDNLLHTLSVITEYLQNLDPEEGGCDNHQETADGN